jgi:MazG family protein
MKKDNEISDNFLNLIKIVEKLRDKENGCLWCNSQTSESIAKYSIEEANEVIDAIKAGDSSNICEELGDLLFQVIFHSQIKSDEKEFDINDVIISINKKMIRRNPHVFNNKNNKKFTLNEIEKNWIKIKNEEKN